MSEVSHDIPQIDNEGQAVNVITDYQVHTVSLVKGCALGRNFVKLKSQAAPDEGGLPLETQEKLNKAKALDAAAQAEAEEVVAEEAVAEEVAVVEGEEAVAEVAVVEGEEAVEVAKSAEEAPEAVAEADPVNPEVVVEAEAEVAAVEEAVEEEQSGDEPEVAPEVVAEEAVAEEVVVEESEAPVEKAKMFTVAELGEVTKASLEAVAKLFKEIAAKAPEANQWEIYDLINGALWAVDDAMWYEKQALQDKIWNEVWDEVESRVNKAKALEVVAATTPVDAMKAFAAANPEMAKLLQAEIETSKSKALEAEADAQAVHRAKALEKGAVAFKRLATEGNSTEAIVDALATIEVASPEAHTVVAKALETASTILMGGELFTDLGSGEALVHETEQEYVDSKAKSIHDTKVAAGQSSNLAAARAEVRQTAEFMALYS